MVNRDSAAELMVEDRTNRRENGTNEGATDAKPVDKYYVSTALFYILGTLNQVPGNFFTTANDYWMYKFRDVNGSNIINEDGTRNKTDLQANFTSGYSIVTNVTMVLSIIVVLKLFKKVPLKLRFTTSLFFMSLMFIITLALVEVDTDEWQKEFFGLTMAIGVILTAADGIFIISLYQLAAKFHPRYIAVVISGQSICGIASALAQILSLGIGASPQITAIVYFSIGTAFVIGSSVAFYVIYKKSDHFHYHFNYVNPNTPTIAITKEMVFTVIGKLKWYLLTIALVLGCSVMVQPSVTSLVTSVDEGNGNAWNDKFYKPVITFLLYNVIDLVGRQMAAAINFPSNGLIMTAVGLSRFAFVPLLMFCNAQPRKHTSVVFNNDYTYIIFIVIFAFTNGYFANLPILQFSKSLQASEKQVAILSVITVIILSLGVCSAMSGLLVNAV